MLCGIFLLCKKYKRNVSLLYKLRNRKEMSCVISLSGRLHNRSELRKVMLEWAKQF